MKVHKAHFGNVYYPVGINFPRNLPAIKKMAEVISKVYSGKKNIFFWVRGSSGAIIAATISALLTHHCVINHVKKEGELSHSHNYYYNCIDEYSVNIIVDDFVNTGETISCILKEYAKYNPDNFIDSIFLVGSMSNDRLADFRKENKIFLRVDTTLYVSKVW